MKKNILLTLLLCSGLMCPSLFAQKKIQRESTPMNISYSLPKAVFKVKVQLACIRQIPGIFCNDAESKLGIIPPFTENTTRWEIINIKVEPTYLPDEKASYVFRFTDNHAAAQFSLTPEGLLAGIAASNPLNFTTQTASYTSMPNVPSVVDPNHLSIFNPLKEVLDTNYTTQIIDGVTKQIWDPIIRTEPKNRIEQLNEAIKEIQRIDAERKRLISLEDEVPDGKALEVLLSELDSMKKEYMSLFIGREECTVIEREIMCTPTRKNVPNLLFHFSKENGIDEKDSSSTTYTLVAINPTIPNEISNDTITTAAIRYRVPASAEIRLLCESKEILSFRAIIPQFGYIRLFPLDAIINESLFLEFYPEYGSIKRIGKNN